MSDRTNTIVTWTQAGALVVIALALLTLAIYNKPHPFKPGGPLGTIQAVTLVNGQVYYGTLKSVQDGVLTLVDVYDVQTTVNPQTNQRAAQLNRRRTTDWHGPVDMAISTDRILFTESVGKDSRVASLVAQNNAPPAAAPSSEAAPSADAKK